MAIERRDKSPRSPWVVILAGGEGVRLRPLVRRAFGEPRPKQFCTLLGSRTLLRQTLDRVGLGFPPARTMVIGLESHARFLDKEFGPGSEPIVLRQPESRGTAAAVLLAAQWLQAHDPGTTAVFFPSDQFVSDEAPFMAQVAEIVRFVQRQPQWLVLLGVEPDRIETEYGWIEPGACVDCRIRCPLYRVARFREKPSEKVARGLFRSGWLWNTLVFAASVPALLDSGRACVPSLSDRLERLQEFWGGEHQRWALRQAYALAPTVSFSESILETCAQPLAVSKVIGLTWRDLGSPERVLETMGAFRFQAPWLAEVKREAR